MSIKEKIWSVLWSAIQVTFFLAWFTIGLVSLVYDEKFIGWTMIITTWSWFFLSTLLDKLLRKTIRDISNIRIKLPLPHDWGQKEFDLAADMGDERTKQLQ